MEAKIPRISIQTAGIPTVCVPMSGWTEQDKYSHIRNAFLLENGDFLLLENGDPVAREQTARILLSKAKAKTK